MLARRLLSLASRGDDVNETMPESLQSGHAALVEFLPRNWDKPESLYLAGKKLLRHSLKFLVVRYASNESEPVS